MPPYIASAKIATASQPAATSAACGPPNWTTPASAERAGPAGRTGERAQRNATPGRGRPQRAGAAGRRRGGPQPAPSGSGGGGAGGGGGVRAGGPGGGPGGVRGEGALITTRVVR